MKNALRLSITVVNRLDLLVERIQRELNERKMKTIDLIRQSGANQSSVYNLMSGKYSVKPETLKLIGYVLDIPTLELAYYIGLTDEMPQTREIQNAVFIAEWERASPDRRRDLLELLRALNKVDAKEGKKV